jgi:hypothetical protein
MLNKIKKITLMLFIMIFAFSAAAIAFDSGSFYAEKEETETTIIGDIKPEIRVFDDGDLEENLSGQLDISYPGSRHSFQLITDFQIGAAEEIEFNELNYQYYGDKYNLLIGKHRVIWGKGDQLHVLDNINPEDLSDFYNPDYKDRQIGEEMIKIDRYFRNGNANLEFIYTPDFESHRLAEDPDSPLGNWIINPFADKISLSELKSATNYSATEIINQVEAQVKEEEQQFGLRFTDTRAGTDYGFSYYHGYLREPSYDPSALSFNLSSLSGNTAAKNRQLFKKSLNAADLHYDQVDVFGFEMAQVIATINSRFELAYYNTDDSSGSQQTVRNNKLAWVIGGDRDLPISNLNLNIQFTGQKILDDDQIEANGASDLQFNSDGDYTTNRAVVKLEDSYQNEKIIPQLTWVYNLRENDYSLEAAVEYELKQDLVLEVSHKIFNGDQDTDFGQFEDNDYTAFALSYDF